MCPRFQVNLFLRLNHDIQQPRIGFSCLVSSVWSSVCLSVPIMKSCRYTGCDSEGLLFPDRQIQMVDNRREMRANARSFALLQLEINGTEEGTKRDNHQSPQPPTQSKKKWLPYNATPASFIKISGLAK